MTNQPATPLKDKKKHTPILSIAWVEGGMAEIHVDMEVSPDVAAKIMAILYRPEKDENDEEH
jgi:hypothetical protein